MTTTPAETPLVSILVVTYRQHQLLARCLAGLDAATAGITTETIVVVNGVPLQPEHRAAAAAGAHVVQAPVNLGLAGGLHLARSHAHGRYLAVVQDDAMFDADWLQPLVSVLDAEPSVGAVGSRMTLLDGEGYGDGLLVSRDGWATMLHPEPRTTPTWAVDACFSAACLVRAQAWDSVGGPNPRLFPLWMVDIDLGLRLNTAEWTVLVAATSVARHQRHGSTTSWLRRYLGDHNRRMVARGHRAFLASRPADVIAGDDVYTWLAHDAAAAQRRRDAPRPERVVIPPVALEHLERWARTDARRVRFGLVWFRVRSAIGYRWRVLMRALRLTPRAAGDHSR